MNKQVSILLTIAATAILFIGAGVWYASTLVNPAALTALIQSSIKEASGRDVIIAGPVRLSIFPVIGVVAEQVSMSNAPWASERQMVKLQRIDLDIKLSPLLKRKIEIGHIKLSGLELYLQTQKDGLGNWVFTPSMTSANFNSAGDSGVTDFGGGALNSPEEITITDARIHFQNAGEFERIYEMPKLSLVRSWDETNVELDLKANRWTLGVKGRMTDLYKLINDWGIKPVTMDTNFTVHFNGKPLLLAGTASKVPGQLPRIDFSLSSKSFDAIPLVGAAVVASNRGSETSVKTAPVSSSPYLFSAQPIAFNLLPQVNGKIAVQIGELVLPDRLPLKNVDASFLFHGDAIDLQKMTFQLGSGLAEVKGVLSQLKGSAPTVTLQGYAKNFTLGNLLQSMDAKYKATGGPMKVAFNLKGSGLSVHQLLGNSSGKVQLTVGQATMGSNFLNNGGDFIVTLLDAVNPLRNRTSQTTLECVVAYLPVSNGQISIAKSVGVQTDRLNVVLSGGLNLKTEQVDLSIAPREKSGLSTGLDLGGLVKLQGTLMQPKATINKEGVVNSAISIGLGILTGGATIVAENAKSIATKVQPCADALHPWADIYPGMN
jgi:AsmA family protein